MPRLAAALPFPPLGGLPPGGKRGGEGWAELGGRSRSRRHLPAGAWGGSGLARPGGLPRRHRVLGGHLERLLRVCGHLALVSSARGALLPLPAQGKRAGEWGGSEARAGRRSGEVRPARALDLRRHLQPLLQHRLVLPPARGDRGLGRGGSGEGAACGVRRATAARGGGRAGWRGEAWAAGGGGGTASGALREQLRFDARLEVAARRVLVLAVLIGEGDAVGAEEFGAQAEGHIVRFRHAAAAKQLSFKLEHRAVWLKAHAACPGEADAPQSASEEASRLSSRGTEQRVDEPPARGLARR